MDDFQGIVFDEEREERGSLSVVTETSNGRLYFNN